MTVLFLLLLLFVSAYAAALIYYLVHWKETGLNAAGRQRFITVIIPVRNEEENLGGILDDLQKQHYPVSMFEVIVVDDHSDDGTLDIAKAFAANSHLDLHIAVSSGTGKKAAIETAVDLAKGDRILTTDADCSVPPGWVGSHAGFTTDMVAAPVRLNADRGFAGRFQQLDYMALQVVGLASAATPFPLMCSGANLSFEKQAFKRTGGYSGNRKIASGDDTFLMLSMKQLNLSIQPAISKEITVSAAAVTGLSSLLNQRRRWASKTKYYKSDYIKYFAALVVAANLAFVTALGLLLLTPFCWAGAVVFLKLAVDAAVIRRGAVFFDLRISPALFLIAEFFYPFFMLLVLLPLKTSWKKRLL